MRWEVAPHSRSMSSRCGQSSRSVLVGELLASRWQPIARSAAAWRPARCCLLAEYCRHSTNPSRPTARSLEVREVSSQALGELSGPRARAHLKKATWVAAQCNCRFAQERRRAQPPPRCARSSAQHLIVRHISRPGTFKAPKPRKAHQYLGARGADPSHRTAGIRLKMRAPAVAVEGRGTTFSHCRDECPTAIAAARAASAHSRDVALRMARSSGARRAPLCLGRARQH